MSPLALSVATCAMLGVSMLPSATFPALLPHFLDIWSLSSTEAGWISGIYYAGYVVVVPVLTSMTDRVDARRVLLAALLLTTLASLGFALFADGLWSATVWRTMQGIGLAGTYMPGLKALTDRIPERMHSRAIAFYTSSFGVGTSLSYLIAGEAAAILDWRWAFALSGLGGALALALAAWALVPMPAQRDAPPTRLLDFRPVLANRRAMAFTLAYMLHNAELFALRAWVVAYLVYCQGRAAGDEWGIGIRATVIAMVVNLLGMPASVSTNEATRRFGRPRTLLVAMGASGVVAVVLGQAATLPYWWVLAVVVVYGWTVSADSATLTAGTVENADPRYRGATMAVHSTIGFLGAVLGPVLFGFVLDAGGGVAIAGAWGWAFAAMAVLIAMGPICIYGLHGPDRRGP